MGVYIKGMDLTEIEKLVLTKNVQMIFIWASDMKLTAKTRTESDSKIVSYSKEFDVVEVPEPHGRLIDADKVKEKYVWLWPSIDHFLPQEKAVRLSRIDDVPTVIEAEGE